VKECDFGLHFLAVIGFFDAYGRQVLIKSFFGIFGRRNKEKKRKEKKRRKIESCNEISNSNRIPLQKNLVITHHIPVMYEIPAPSAIYRHLLKAQAQASPSRHLWRRSLNPRLAICGDVHSTQARFAI